MGRSQPLARPAIPPVHLLCLIPRPSRRARALGWRLAITLRDIFGGVRADAGPAGGSAKGVRRRRARASVPILSVFAGRSLSKQADSKPRRSCPRITRSALDAQNGTRGIRLTDNAIVVEALAKAVREETVDRSSGPAACRTDGIRVACVSNRSAAGHRSEAIPSLLGSGGRRSRSRQGRHDNIKRVRGRSRRPREIG
jgi:hypothetical protein